MDRSGEKFHVVDIFEHSTDRECFGRLDLEY